MQIMTYNNPGIMAVINQLSQYTDFFSPRMNRNSLDFAFFSEIRWYRKFEKRGMDPHAAAQATMYPRIGPVVA